MWAHTTAVCRSSRQSSGTQTGSSSVPASLAVMKVHLVLGAVALTALLLTTTQLAGETSPAAAPTTTTSPPVASSSVPPAPAAPPPRVYASSSDLPDGLDFPAAGAGSFHV